MTEIKVGGNGYGRMPLRYVCHRSAFKNCRKMRLLPTPKGPPQRSPSAADPVRERTRAARPTAGQRSSTTIAVIRFFWLIWREFGTDRKSRGYNKRFDANCVNSF